MKKLTFLLLLLGVGSLSLSDTLLLRESFEGTNFYSSNSFSDGNSDYFTLWHDSLKLNQDFTGADSNNYFVAEDVDEAENPLGAGEAGYIRFNTVNLEGYDSVRIKILLAATDGEYPEDPQYQRNQFGPEDSLQLLYAWGADSGDIPVNSGIYSVLSVFRGFEDIAKAVYSYPFSEDADNDGIIDDGGVALSSVFQEVVYTLPVDSAMFSFKLRIDVDGYDDVGIDDIRIYGVVKTPKPDIDITSFYMSPANPHTKDSITFTSIVKNIDTVSSDSFKLLLRVGSEANPPKFTVPVLAFNETFTVQRKIKLTVAQQYLSEVIADCDGDIIESDETNNRDTLIFTVEEAVITVTYDTAYHSVKDTLSNKTTEILVNLDTVITTIYTENCSSYTYIETDSLINGVSFFNKIDTTISFISTDIDTVKDTIPYDKPVAIDEVGGDPVTNRSELLFAPNPVPAEADGVFFVTPSALTGEWEVVIFDNLGDIVDKQTFRSNGGYTYRWNLKNLKGFPVSGGTYVAVIRIKNDRGDIELFKKLIGVSR